MALIFIPGYGETPSIFDKIHPHLPGEKVFVDHWDMLGEQDRRGLTALDYARELVARFNISIQDVVNGHSMGGWIALHIKHLVQCPVVQISSWTDPRKVVTPIRNRRMIYWLTKKGFVYNRKVKAMVVKSYKGKPSYELFSATIERLIRGNKNTVVNQLRVIFNPVKEDVDESPDLRIHARADPIVRFPDQPAREVPGDHFSLFTYPEKVYPPILAFLQGVQ